METEIAGANLRDAVRSGLDDADGNEVFATWTGDEDHDDGTRTPITLSGGLWRRRKADGTLVTGQARDTNVPGGTVKLRSQDRSARAFGYALVAKDHRDVRPDLLRLVWDHDLRTLPKLIGYGRDYLRASGHTRPADALEAAAADALLILTHGLRRRRPQPQPATRLVLGIAIESAPHPDYRHPAPRGPTLHARDAQFRLHHGTFGSLRKVALLAFRRRYREACERFRAVYDWTPTACNIGHGGFKPDSLWHPERIKRGFLTTHFVRIIKGAREDRTVQRFPAARRAA